MYRKKTLKSAGITPGIFFCNNRRVWKILSAVMFLGFYWGCASAPVTRTEKIPVDRFQAFKLAGGGIISPESVERTVPDVNILEINSEIMSLLDEKVTGIRDTKARLQALMDILVTRVNYDTRKDSYGVKTAQNTFDTGTGNCLSFSNLFIAMARYSGFKADYQEIPTLPNWSREGEIIFFTRHIGASVDVRESLDHIIQIKVTNDMTTYEISNDSLRYFFAPSELDPRQSRINPFFFKPIADNRAFAQFYNNLGSRLIAKGDNAGAFRYFVKAIKTDPELNFAWSNLGVVYRKNMQFDAAEDAYFQGLAATVSLKDPGILTIMNNLANLYEMKGDLKKAEIYKAKVASFRKKNPYYQYAVAKNAYFNASYKNAVSGFKEAIRLKKDEHLFYYGLALTYRKLGDIKLAEKNIDRAIKYSWDKKEKAYYKKYKQLLIGNGLTD